MTSKKIDVENWSYKSLLTILFFLLIAIVAIIKFSSSTKVSAGWFNDAWNYRKAISISNSSGSNLTDFQIPISIGTSSLINSGKMQSDCDDIRVTDTNGKLLNYWLSGCNTSNTQIWPKIPSIPNGGATVYVYYGNPSATSAKTTVGTSDYPGLSCKSILDAGNSIGIGNYWIDPTNGDPSNKFQAYCDMTNNGGGWMLVTPSMIGSTYASYFTPSSSTDQYGGVGYNFVATGTGCGNGQDPIATVLISNNYQWDRVKSKKTLGPTGTAACWGLDGNSAATNDNLQTFNASYDTLQNCILSCSTSPFVMPPMNRCDNDAPNFARYNSSSSRSFEQISRRINRTTISGPSVSHACSSMGLNWRIDDIYIREDTLTFSATAGSPATEEVGTGPIAYWKFDEGIGTTAYDSTSNRNNGTISGATWQTDDQCISGKCLYFSGVGSANKVDLGTSSKLDPSNFTVSSWVKVIDASTNYGYIYSNDRDCCETLNGFSLLIGNGKLSGQAWNSTGVSISSNSNIPSNKWTYVTFSYDGSNLKLYIDGKLDKTQSYVGGIGSPASRNSSIGTMGHSQGYYTLKGYLDELKLYAYARTAAQIKSDYAAGKAHTSSTKGSSVNLGGNNKSGDFLSDGLVGYWKMDENTGTSLVDNSGNGNNATFFGSPSWSSGKFGSGVNNGNTISDFIDAPNVSIGTSWTASAWFLYPLTSTGSGWWTLFRSNVNDHQVIVQRSDSQLGMYDNASGTGFRGTGYLMTSLANGWHQIAVTGSGGSQKFYIDGNYVGQADKQSISDIKAIGNYQGGSQNWGTIDEVRIYNRALSSSEVSQLYNWAPGPVGYWKLDEKTGTIANDSSGIGNTTSLVSNPIWTQGKFGGALNFDGSTNYINAGNNQSLNPYYAETIDAWVKLDVPVSSQSSPYPQIMGKRDVDTQRAYFLSFETASSKLYWEIKDSAGTYYTLYSIKTDWTPGVWYHIAATFDGAIASNNAKVFINGIQDNQTTWGLTYVPQTSATARIGGGNYYLDGSLDDVKLYNYARTIKQIVEDMNAGHPAGGSPVGSQVGYWKFDEGYGSQINNSGNGGIGLNGAINGATWTNNGKYNKALLFDGTDDYVIANNQTSLNPTSITISMWLNLNIDPNCDGNNNWRSLLHKGSTSATATGYDIILEESRSIAWDTGNGATDRWWPNNISIPIGSWTQLVLTYDETGKKLAYINGKLADTKTVSAAPLASNTSNLYINNPSSACPAGAGNFPGIIDEVKIYNYALTEDEIKIDYNRNSALQMGSLSSGTGNTAPSTAASQEYCVPGDTINCSSPVAEWKFEEGIGTSAYDSSGNNLGGFFEGSPSWVSGKIGKAISFNASNAVVKVIDNAILKPTTAITAEAWFNTTNKATTAQRILSKTEGSGYQLSINENSACPASTLCFLVNINGTYYSATYASSNLTNNTWYHVAGTYDGSIVKLFLNGSSIGTTATISNTITQGAYNMCIGSETDGGSCTSGFFSGKIDNVRIFNYARTPAQIAYDYNRGAPIGWWKFDECQGSTAYDSSGIGNTGSIIIGSSGSQNSLGTCQVGTSAAWTNGAVGKLNSSLNFDGVDDYVEIASNFGIFQNYTITFWAKHNVASKMPFASRVDTSFYWYGDNSWRYVHGGVGGEFYYPKSVSIPYGTWGYFTVTYDGINVRIYRNGKLEGSQGSTGTANFSNGFYLGQWAADTSYRFQGQMDDVRIYNYALTATQVKLLYNGGAVNFSP